MKTKLNGHILSSNVYRTNPFKRPATTFTISELRGETRPEQVAAGRGSSLDLGRFPLYSKNDVYEVSFHKNQ